MNGYECGVCDMAPCVCRADARRRRIKSGQEAIQSIHQAGLHLTGWRRRLVKFLWPDLLHVMDDIRAYNEDKIQTHLL